MACCGPGRPQGAILRRAEHLKSKASRGKVTPALASEMVKTDVNKIYTHAFGGKSGPPFGVDAASI